VSRRGEKRGVGERGREGSRDVEKGREFLRKAEKGGEGSREAGQGFCVSACDIESCDF
jgi:hypothetical protein